MKKFLLFLLLFFMSVIAQFILTGWTGKVTLDFFLVLVVFWSYFREWKEGILIGFVCGLTKDIFFFPLMGINAFSFSLIAILISEAKQRIYQQNVILFTLMAGAAFLINSFLASVWLFLFYRFPLLSTFTEALYPSVFYTCGLCGGIFLIQERLTRRFIPSP